MSALHCYRMFLVQAGSESLVRYPVCLGPHVPQLAGGVALVSERCGTPRHTVPCCCHPILLSLPQVLPLLEAVMGPAGPAEVPGAGSVAIGRTQLDRLLRVIPKPASVSINQLRLAASIAGQDQVGWSCRHMG